MKVNVFVSTRSGGNFAGSFPHSSITGEQVDGPEAPEDSIIAAIDEDRISPEKALAVRFLTFLGNHRLTIESLNILSSEEQARLKKEFIEG